MALSRNEPQMLGGFFSNIWSDLPDSLVLHIFCFLSPREIVLAGQVCRNWHRLSKDEMLWKRLLQETLFDGTRENVELPKSSSWFEEFQWIHQKTPCVQGQVLKEHADEVLHVAFSHDGNLLSTSSKDCSVILWRVDNLYHVSVVEKMSFKEHNWEYVQFSEFNATDTLLLVSGVNKMRDFHFRGEIFICELEGSSVVGMHIIHNVNNEPYDVFGAWLSERCYISGTFEFILPGNYHSSLSELWVNSVDDKFNRNRTKLARIFNDNASSVRTVLIARPSRDNLHPVDGSAVLQSDDNFCLIFTHGTVTYVPHQIVFKWLKLKRGSNSPTKRKQLLLRDSDTKNIHVESTDNGEADNELLYTIQDHCIETNSHIIGMSLSPDHHYLYVNCRQWQQQDEKQHTGSAFESPPEISSDITLQVYSLSTYELVSVHCGHQAYTANDGCFFIFLNVADRMVASGAEDCCAHVWDRHYRAKLATLMGHTGVVNCVAFNPVNQQMLVSVSDDHTVRVWRSRQLSRLDESDKLESEEYYEGVRLVEEGLCRETSV